MNSFSHNHPLSPDKAIPDAVAKSSLLLGKASSKANQFRECFHRYIMHLSPVGKPTNHTGNCEQHRKEIQREACEILEYLYRGDTQC